MEKRALGRGLDALLPTVDSATRTVDRGEAQELGIDSIVPNRYPTATKFS
ncbi:MAG: hypothetical protein KatS3mg082_2293 [Nitrospiraceae bacterium]|nr:MAG: hypothetical protein KatS3mg082_2293 [Nitrospiraceae bacterium]